MRGFLTIIDDFEVLQLKKEYEEAGARKERQRLTAEVREAEVHAELLAKLRTARLLLAKVETGTGNICREIRHFIEDGEEDGDD